MSKLHLAKTDAFNEASAVTSNFEESAKEGTAFLELLLEQIPAFKRFDLCRDLDRLISLTDETMEGRTYATVSTEVKEFWRTLTTTHGIDETYAGGVLLSTLIAKSPQRSLMRNIPTALVPDINKQFVRILSDLEAGNYKQFNFENDKYIKELGICRLELLPCGAQLLDKNSGIPRRLAFGNGFGQMFSFMQVAMLGKGRFAPYFEGHNHTPMVDDFTPEGFERHYMLVAELLKKNPDCLGLIGGTWWYDPEVHKISPHLTYLRQRPEEGGAIFLKNVTSQADINNATTNSWIRRKRYEEGKYIPTGYFMVWPRNRLLAWTQRNAK
jgi:hypothetical protein